MIHPITPNCFANHLGYWLAKPEWVAAALAHIKAGTWVAHREDQFNEGSGFQRTSDGIAVVGIQGPMMKGASKFGGASTVETRLALREAAADPDIRGILMAIDSPGGHVAGTQQLADEVKRVDAVKPVHAHIEDMGASAALWVASQARHVTANRTAEVGSIGVLAALEDSSEQAKAEGVTVHVISTGEFKGMGMPGAPVTKAHVAHASDLAHAIFGHFQGAVQAGRNMTDAEVAAVSDGRTWLAEEALSLKLIDGVGGLDEAAAGFGRRRRAARARAAFNKNRFMS